MKRLCAVLAFAFLLIPLAFSQAKTAQLKVTVVWEDGSRLGDKQDVAGMPGVQGTSRDSPGPPIGGSTVSNMGIRIAVLNDMGQTIAESSPSSQGDVTFNLVGSVRNSRGYTQEVTYRVRVFGADIEEENIEGVTPAGEDHFLTVKIRRKGEKEGRGGIVSANALKIPKKAEKEFQRGDKAMSAKKYPEARDHFETAIALYPAYDIAYNGLGATQIAMGNLDAAQKAFAKSVEVNNKFAPGYRNLAMLAAHDKDYSKAAILLERSLALEPMNVDALSRLAQFDHVLGKDNDVPDLVHRMHALPHPGQELAHFAAASSLERMNKPDEAIGEYTLFLKEAPDNKLAPQAKESIERCRQKLNEPTTQ